MACGEGDLVSVFDGGDVEGRRMRFVGREVERVEVALVQGGRGNDGSRVADKVFIAAAGLDPFPNGNVLEVLTI